MFDDPNLLDDRCFPGVDPVADLLHDPITPDVFYLMVGESAGEEFDNPFTVQLTGPEH